MSELQSTKVTIEDFKFFADGYSQFPDVILKKNLIECLVGCGMSLISARRLIFPVTLIVDDEFIDSTFFEETVVKYAQQIYRLYKQSSDMFGSENVLRAAEKADIVWEFMLCDQT